MPREIAFHGVYMPTVTLMFLIAAVLAWSGLASVAVASNLDPGPWVTGGLVVVAAYVVAVGLTDGLKTDDRAAA